MLTKSLGIYVGSGLLLAILAGTSVYLYQERQNKIVALNELSQDRDNVIKTNSALAESLNAEVTAASSTIASLTAEVARLTELLEDTERKLSKEENRNEEFEDQIKKISGTVGVLDKLSKTDRELLAKYSKTYFLNENFIPMKISPIASEYVLSGKKDQYFHGDALEFLTDMFDEAAEDGFELKVISAYRSFDEQAQLKGQYTQIYGSGANTFSADQGYSEHQLGTTLDLTDPSTGGTYTSFGDTPAFAWLMDNAYRFGFILSYPKDNGFYIYEPWHWRFVGVDLATDLRREGVSFYAWDQRKIDDYLVNIFD
jgi:zinc D-Ala-D-Ala carboxypeptidase